METGWYRKTQYFRIQLWLRPVQLQVRFEKSKKVAKQMIWDVSYLRINFKDTIIYDILTRIAHSEYV